MNLLFTNLSLSSGSGTEWFTRDLARSLQALGHNVALYSPVTGDFAERLAEDSLKVYSSLEQVPFTPDLIHGHHHVEIMSALLYFPGVPAVFVCHDRRSWHDRAPLFPRIRRYVGVDEACRKRLIHDGAEESKTVMIHNSFDPERFRLRTPLPDKPQKALLFTHYATESLLIPEVEDACGRLGIELDIAGRASGNPIDHPEEILGNYDIVFAKARCGLEAMATGCAVVLVDPHGAGPMVTTKNWETLRPLNFGFEACPDPLTAEHLVGEAARYDANEARQVAELTHREASLPRMTGHFLELYETVIEEQRSTTIDPLEETQAASNYLRQQFDYQWLMRASQLEEEVAHWRASAEMAHRGWAELGDRFVQLQSDLKKATEETPPPSLTN